MKTNIDIRYIDIHGRKGSEEVQISIMDKEETMLKTDVKELIPLIKD
ncbi:hypothetical protein STRDD10_00521 [Streptococcus sp. DD10]|nr:hypothetical protein STRDD10_00521 [Streptococcus sp. DD10]